MTKINPIKFTANDAKFFKTLIPLLFLVLSCETAQTENAPSKIKTEKSTTASLGRLVEAKKTIPSNEIEKLAENSAVIRLTPSPKNSEEKCIQDPLSHAHNETKNEKEWTNDGKPPLMVRTDEAIDLDGDGVAEYIYTGGNQFNKISPFLIYLSNKGCTRFVGQHWAVEGVAPQNLKGPRTNGVLDLSSNTSTGCAGGNRAYSTAIYDKKKGFYRTKERFNCTFCTDDLTSKAPISNNVDNIKRCQEVFPKMYSDWKKAFKK